MAEVSKAIRDTAESWLQQPFDEQVQHEVRQLLQDDPEELKERFRSIIQNDAGEIFVSTDNGRILKISFADDLATSKLNIFRHIDTPGFYLSVEINYLLSK